MSGYCDECGNTLCICHLVNDTGSTANNTGRMTPRNEKDFPYPHSEGQTHCDDCWQWPRHHNCAVAKVDQLQAGYNACSDQLTEAWEDIANMNKYATEMEDRVARALELLKFLCDDGRGAGWMTERFRAIRAALTGDDLE